LNALETGAQAVSHHKGFTAHACKQEAIRPVGQLLQNAAEVINTQGDHETHLTRACCRACPTVNVGEVRRLCSATHQTSLFASVWPETSRRDAERLQLPQLSYFYLQYCDDKLVVMLRDRDFGQTSYLILIHLQGGFKLQYQAIPHCYCCITTLRPKALLLRC